jgi:hypothetical protein
MKEKRHMNDRDHLKNLGLPTKIILKLISKIQDGCEID